MMAFLAHPAPRALTYRPGSAHPTGYIRAFILAAMLDRMGFSEDAAAAREVWNALYDPAKGHRIPRSVLAAASAAIPLVVDEIAFQPRRALGQRALADIIPFTRADAVAIRRGGMQLAAGQFPAACRPAIWCRRQALP